MSEAQTQGETPGVVEAGQASGWSTGQMIYAGIWAAIALLIIGTSSTLFGLLVFAYFVAPVVFYRRCLRNGITHYGARMAAVVALSSLMAFMVLGSSAYKRDEELAGRMVDAGLNTDEHTAIQVARELREEEAVSRTAESLTGSEFVKFMLYLGAMGWLIVALSKPKKVVHSNDGQGSKE